MTPRALAHPLRRVIVIAFMPALVLNIIEAAVVNSGKPLVGIPVHFVSAIMCTAYLLHERRVHHEGAIHLGPSVERPVKLFYRPWFLLVLDALFSALFLVILVLRWIWVPRYSGQAILAAYAEVPFLVTWISHIYLFLLTLSDLVGLPRMIELLLPTKPCPNCERPRHSNPPLMGSVPTSQHLDCDSQASAAGASTHIMAYHDENQGEESTN